jgi:CMP-N,N'-diacetyllegionaminic acid synthase
MAAELCLFFDLKTIRLSHLGGCTLKYLEYALIPARGGSRGIPRKNLAVIGTKTLLEKTIETALACNVFQKIFVSSDDYELLNLAYNYPVDIHQRSAWASGDDATASDVLRNFLEVFDETTLKSIRITYLQPTSPFRTVDSILQALSKADGHESGCCVSITKAKNIPHKMVTVDNGILHPFLLQSGESLTANRQQLPDIYLPNGSIYVFPIWRFLNTGSIPIKGASYLILNERESLDIDSSFDLEIARLLDEQLG